MSSAALKIIRALDHIRIARNLINSASFWDGSDHDGQISGLLDEDNSCLKVEMNDFCNHAHHGIETLLRNELILVCKAQLKEALSDSKSEFKHVVFDRAGGAYLHWSNKVDTWRKPWPLYDPYLLQIFETLEELTNE